jgi:hydrogenase assembly chaperone HypC/HupF
MCVATAGKVIEVRDDATALVDFDGNRVSAMTGLVKVSEGDYVLVHAGCVIQVLDEAEATSLNDLMREIEGL